MPLRIHHQVATRISTPLPQICCTRTESHHGKLQTSSELESEVQSYITSWKSAQEKEASSRFLPLGASWLHSALALCSDIYVTQRQAVVNPTNQQPPQEGPPRGRPARGRPARGRPAQGRPAQGRPAQGQPPQQGAPAETRAPLHRDNSPSPPSILPDGAQRIRRGSPKMPPRSNQKHSRRRGLSELCRFGTEHDQA